VIHSCLHRYGTYLLTVRVAPSKDDVDATSWSYLRYETKVFPFIFNPLFIVVDAVPTTDLNSISDIGPQQGDHAHSSMDSDHNRTSFKPADVPREDAMPSVGGIDMLEAPPPPPCNGGFAFDAIAAEQEDLRDARESLMGFRFRLRTKRRELQVAREKAGSKAGTAINLVRRYLQEQGIELPADITSVFSEVDVLRDELGMQEVDYEESEEKFNSEEWKYTQEEEEVIEALTAYRPPSQVLPTHTLSGMHEVPDMLPDADKHLALEEGPPMFTNLTNGQDDVINVIDNRPESEGQVIGGSIPVFSQFAPSRNGLAQLTEGQKFGHPQEQWPRTRERINDWLWEIMTQSTFHKERLRDEHEWLKLVARHWSSDGLQSFTFHTGDTTASEPLNKPASSVAVEQPWMKQFEQDLGLSALFDLPGSTDEGRADLASYPSGIALEDDEITVETDDKSHHTPQHSTLDNNYTEPASVTTAQSSSFGEFLPARAVTAGYPLTKAVSAPVSQGSYREVQNRLPARSYTSDNLRGLSMAVSNLDDRVDSIHSEMSHKKSSSSLKTPVSVLEERDCSAWSSSLFIRVDKTQEPKADSWRLPLVWLGLVAGPKRPKEVPDSELFPFVTLPDTPFRLPGPSQSF
jgi:hypothetical protein